MGKQPKKSAPENTRESRDKKTRDEKGHFLPGVSGNPGGRPRTALLSQAYREELEEVSRGNKTTAQKIAKRIVKVAMLGKKDSQAVMAASELADRTEGRAPQSVRLEPLMSEDTMRRILELGKLLDK